MSNFSASLPSELWGRMEGVSLASYQDLQGRVVLELHGPKRSSISLHACLELAFVVSPSLLYPVWEFPLNSKGVVYHVWERANSFAEYWAGSCLKVRLTNMFYIRLDEKLAVKGPVHPNYNHADSIGFIFPGFDISVSDIYFGFWVQIKTGEVLNWWRFDLFLLVYKYVFPPYSFYFIYNFSFCAFSP